MAVCLSVEILIRVSGKCGIKETWHGVGPTIKNLDRSRENKRNSSKERWEHMNEIEVVI